MKSIYKIPAFIRGVNEKVYKPLIVSFGPFHHEEVHLKSMEEYKKNALRTYLYNNNLNYYKLLQDLKEMEDKFMEAYHSLDRELWLNMRRDSSNSFEKMLAEDAAFMLQFIIQYVKNRGGDNNEANTGVNLSQLKPIVMRDMLLLENQLPLLLLQQFMHYFEEANPYKDLITYIVEFFDIDPCLVSFDSERPYLHILHLYGEAKFAKVRPPVPEIATDSRIDVSEGDATERADSIVQRLPVRRGYGGGMHLHSLFLTIKEAVFRTRTSTITKKQIQIPWAASEMRDFGIQFEESGSESILGISFQRKLLKLSVLELDDVAESALANLVAFERLHFSINDTNHWGVRSYILFMRNLVQKEADVSILKSKRLLVDYRTGNDKTPVWDYLATISKNLRVQDLPKSDELFDVYERVEKYCNKTSSMLHASVTRRFVQGNWPEVSIAAAIILFVLTALQTLFTILAYFKT